MRACRDHHLCAYVCHVLDVMWERACSMAKLEGHVSCFYVHVMHGDDLPWMMFHEEEF